jgi:hypothetical protein
MSNTERTRQLLTAVVLLVHIPSTITFNRVKILKSFKHIYRLHQQCKWQSPIILMRLYIFGVVVAFQKTSHLCCMDVRLILLWRFRITADSKILNLFTRHYEPDISLKLLDRTLYKYLNSIIRNPWHTFVITSNHPVTNPNLEGCLQQYGVTF